jgi:hypothetical protein
LTSDVPEVLCTQALHCHSSAFSHHNLLSHGFMAHQNLPEQFTPSQLLWVRYSIMSTLYTRSFHQSGTRVLSWRNFYQCV